MDTVEHINCQLLSVLCGFNIYKTGILVAFENILIDTKSDTRNTSSLPKLEAC